MLQLDFIQYSTSLFLDLSEIVQLIIALQNTFRISKETEKLRSILQQRVNKQFSFYLSSDDAFLLVYFMNSYINTISHIDSFPNQVLPKTFEDIEFINYNISLASCQKIFNLIITDFDQNEIQTILDSKFRWSNVTTFKNAILKVLKKYGSLRNMIYIQNQRLRLFSLHIRLQFLRQYIHCKVLH